MPTYGSADQIEFGKFVPEPIPFTLLEILDDGSLIFEGTDSIYWLYGVESVDVRAAFELLGESVVVCSRSLGDDGWIASILHKLGRRILADCFVPNPGFDLATRLLGTGIAKPQCSGRTGSFRFFVWVAKNKRLSPIGVLHVIFLFTIETEYFLEFPRFDGQLWA